MDAKQLMQSNGPVSTSSSDAPYPENTRSDVTGQRLIDVLNRAWQGGFRVSSSFARNYAPEVAAAASRGYITTETEPMEYGKDWYITYSGLCYLKH